MSPTTAGVTYPVLIDLTLSKTSKAIDRGVYIPNVTDDFTGAGPDLGAYQYGQPCLCTGRAGAPDSGVE